MICGLRGRYGFFNIYHRRSAAIKGKETGSVSAFLFLYKAKKFYF